MRPLSTRYPDSSITVVMPVYNEQEALPPAVRQLDAFLAESFSDYEVLIVESGSTDGTGAACDALAEQLPHVRVLHEGARNGFGSALELGYGNATKELVWMVTSDVPFDLAALHEAMPRFAEVDVVLSYRASDPRGLFRKLQSVVYNTLVKCVLGLRVKQVNSAFKMYRREVIQKIPIISRGWFVDAEILYRIKQAGVPFCEIPVALIDRSVGKSSVGLLAFVAILRELWFFLRHKDSVPANPPPR